MQEPQLAANVMQAALHQRVVMAFESLVVHGMPEPERLAQWLVLQCMASRGHRRAERTYRHGAAVAAV